MWKMRWFQCLAEEDVLRNALKRDIIIFNVGDCAGVTFDGLDTDSCLTD